MGLWDQEVERVFCKERCKAWNPRVGIGVVGCLCVPCKLWESVCLLPGRPPCMFPPGLLNSIEGLMK